MNPFDCRWPMTTMIFLFLRSARQGTARSFAIRASRAAVSRSALSSGWENRNPCAQTGPAARTTSSRSIDRVRAGFIADRGGSSGLAANSEDWPNAYWKST
ncbi:MAG: hypothetical protein ABI349_03225 [Casimicrobiaceae bacterium]